MNAHHTKYHVVIVHAIYVTSKPSMCTMHTISPMCHRRQTHLFLVPVTGALIPRLTNVVYVIACPQKCLQRVPPTCGKVLRLPRSFRKCRNVVLHAFHHFLFKCTISWKCKYTAILVCTHALPHEQAQLTRRPRTSTDRHTQLWCDAPWYR